MGWVRLGRNWHSAIPHFHTSAYIENMSVWVCCAFRWCRLMCNAWGVPLRLSIRLWSKMRRRGRGQHRYRRLDLWIWRLPEPRRLRGMTRFKSWQLIPPVTTPEKLRMFRHWLTAKNVNLLFVQSEFIKSCLRNSFLGERGYKREQNIFEKLSLFWHWLTTK